MEEDVGGEDQLAGVYWEVPHGRNLVMREVE